MLKCDWHVAKQLYEMVGAIKGNDKGGWLEKQIGPALQPADHSGTTASVYVQQQTSTSKVSQAAVPQAAAPQAAAPPNIHLKPRTVLVKDFPEHITVDDIASLFRKLGNVENVSYKSGMFDFIYFGKFVNPLAYMAVIKDEAKVDCSALLTRDHWR